MSLPFRHLYEFGEFCLDIREKILTRGGEAVELTPKGFELLSVLVENHGRLLEKEELMDKIWADSFVEESNLTFNIRQLRKILGDDAHAPKYIKTVRRHGYRFIADVRESTAEEKSPPSDDVSPADSRSAALPSAEENFDSQDKKRFLTPILLLPLLLFVGAAIVATVYVRRRNIEPTAPVLNVPFASEKLSTNGKTFHAVLSPDGESVIYTNGAISEKQSVRRRQLADGSSVEIIPPSDDVYYGLQIAPDGQQIYFARGARGADAPINIFRVSIFGGVPQKILSGTEGWMSVSPDGAKVSFVRCPYNDTEFCSLWIADAADGKNERKLVARTRPYRISCNTFAPDGKTVAFAVGQSANASNEFGLTEVDVETGAERELTKEKFFNIISLARLSDKSGWMVTASRIPNRSSRIWRISATTDEAVPLTKDSEAYGILSLDKDETKIVSTQIKQNFRLRLIHPADRSRDRILADAVAASFAPDGKIYFASEMSGNREIWSLNADGEQRQLTNNLADEGAPVTSPDGNFVYFVSNRSGAAHVWRMNTDGSDQRQITQQTGGFPLAVTPDGEWIFYHHGIDRTLWRVSSKTGEEQIVLNKINHHFAVSPDGLQVAYPENEGAEKVLVVASLSDGQTLKRFRITNKKFLIHQIAWMNDGKGVAYVSSEQDFGSKTLWLQSFDEETPRRLADLGSEELSSFSSLSALSNDRTFAVIQGTWLHDAVLLKGLK